MVTHRFFAVLLFALCVIILGCEKELTEPLNAVKNLEPYLDIAGDGHPTQTKIRWLTPNPTKGQIVMFFDIAADTSVKILVQNTTGDVITTLLSHQLWVGNWIIQFNLNTIINNSDNEAFYYVSIYAGDYSESRLIKVVR